jgi:hypothetical protein
VNKDVQFSDNNVKSGPNEDDFLHFLRENEQLDTPTDKTTNKASAKDYVVKRRIQEKSKYNKVIKSSASNKLRQKSVKEKRKLYPFSKKNSQVNADISRLIESTGPQYIDSNSQVSEAAVRKYEKELPKSRRIYQKDEVECCEDQELENLENRDLGLDFKERLRTSNNPTRKSAKNLQETYQNVDSATNENDQNLRPINKKQLESREKADQSFGELKNLLGQVIVKVNPPIYFIIFYANKDFKMLQQSCFKNVQLVPQI